MRNSNRAVVQRSSLGLKKLALATLASIPAASWAFGVGDAELRSSYSQPLSLRVPITIGESDHVVDPTELAVRLLPNAAYEGMGLSAPPLGAETVTLNVSGSGTAYWVDVRSTQRVREPMMTLLLEVRLGSMRVVRELPIMFDLPMEPAPQSTTTQIAQTVVTPPAQPVVQVAEQDIVATPLAPADNTAPVALMAPADITPRPQRTIIRRPPKTQKAQAAQAEKPARPGKQSAQPELTSFKLAGWNQSGAATGMAMPRFQLAQRFDSYAALAAAGTPPAPATQIPVITPKPAPVVAPVAMVEEPKPSSGLGGWWLVLLGAVGAVLWLWRRARTQGMAGPSASSGSVIAKSEPVKARAVVEPEPEIDFTPEVEEQAVAAAPAPKAEPAPVMAAPEPAPAAAAAVSSGPQPADLRKRLAELVAKAGGDANLLRKAQLVSAYLDLNRTESAETLLSELETDAGAPARPKFTLIKG